MDASPSISVVMCTYNGADYIPAQLDSILAQTYPVKEIIIQDDQSTDSTLDVLRQYAKKESRIKCFTVDERRGINHNFITACSRATGDLIAWSDQDDIWLPDKLEKQVKDLLEKDLWISFHITQVFCGEVPGPSGDYDRRVPNFGLERELFLGTVPGHTMLLRRSLHEMICSRVPQETMENLHKSFYYDAILSVVGNAFDKIGVIVEPLDLHRRHPGSVSGGFRQDKMKRSLSNAVSQLFRCLSPARRRAVRPVFKRRMDNMEALLNLFPEAGNTAGVREIMAAWRSPARFFAFPRALLHNRDRIFFSREKNDFIARIRAILFAITYQDYFSR